MEFFKQLTPRTQAQIFESEGEAAASDRSFNSSNVELGSPDELMESQDTIMDMSP